MDLSGILDLFGYSVYDPQVKAMLEQCDAAGSTNGFAFQFQ